MLLMPDIHIHIDDAAHVAEGIDRLAGSDVVGQQLAGHHVEHAEPMGRRGLRLSRLDR